MQLLVTVIVALPLLNRAALGDYGAAVAQNFVSAAFIKDEVVPDAIDTAPKQLLNVRGHVFVCIQRPAGWAHWTLGYYLIHEESQWILPLQPRINVVTCGIKSVVI